MQDKQPEKIIDLTKSAFIVSAENNFGMLGTFQGIEFEGKFYTVFIPTATDPSALSPMIRICQHENIDQANEMAKDFNQYSSEM